jgi:predicted hydrolase (HD superfamily)
MWNHWGVQTDEKNNHRLHSKIRKVLHRKWKRDEVGWALHPHLNDIVYELDEFEEWRVAYEAKQQTTSDGVHGIGRFG